MTDGDEGVEDAPPDLRKKYAQLMRKCTPKQRRWLRLVAEMAGQKWSAAEKLGYAKQSVQKWLRLDSTKQILALQASMAEQDHDLTRERILREYERLAFSDLRQLYDASGELKLPHDWDDETAAAVSERAFDERGRPRVKLHDKRGALDAIARIQGVLVDRRELTGLNGQPLATGVMVVPTVVSEEQWAKASADQQASLAEMERKAAGDGSPA